MALPQTSYGPSGGQLQTRFAAENDPREAIALYAAGTMDVSAPPHLAGVAGSCYRYGSTVVGGTKNLLHNGNQAHTCYSQADTFQSMSVLLGTGTTATDGISVIASSAHEAIVGVQFANTTSYLLDAFGEFVYQPTTTAVYGAIAESFTIAGTVSQVTLGSGQIDFTGTTLLTSSLTAAYGYTPSKTLLQPGDIIGITQAATVFWHRIKSIDSNTRLQVYPNWGGANAGPAAGLGFLIKRTGYGSYSRVVDIYNDTNNKHYLYYAGNSRDTQNYGTVECAVLPDNTHFMCPQSAAADVRADDIILYKGYLLYGSGSTVRWSKVGFPNTFPFDAADFPATNTTVVDNSDRFVSFEQIGDQVVALFSKSIWLVFPTGSVPEFNFYRLPEPIGCNQRLALHPGNLSTTIYLRQRPSCSARSSVFYLGKSGLMVTQGGPAQHVSESVDAFWYISPQSGESNALGWEPITNSIIWGSQGTALIYSLELKSWSILDTSFRVGTTCGLTSEVPSSNGLTGSAFRRFGPAFWDSSSTTLIFYDNYNGIDTGGGTTTDGTLPVWSWASKIANLSDVYDKFLGGGIRLEARGLSGITVGIKWVIYGGPNPYTMYARASGTVTTATASARGFLGVKIDDPFVGIVLSGNTTTQWVALVGAMLYPADYMARR